MKKQKAETYTEWKDKQGETWFQSLIQVMGILTITVGILLLWNIGRWFYRVDQATHNPIKYTIFGNIILEASTNTTIQNCTFIHTNFTPIEATEMGTNIGWKWKGNLN